MKMLKCWTLDEGCIIYINPTNILAIDDNSTEEYGHWVVHSIESTGSKSFLKVRKFEWVELGDSIKHLNI